MKSDDDILHHKLKITLEEREKTRRGKHAGMDKTSIKPSKEKEENRLTKLKLN